MVPDRTRSTLVPIIKRFVDVGADIHSDSWRAYNTLGIEGYWHYVVCHKYEFVNVATGAMTQTIEGLWKHLKAAYRKHGGLKSQDLELFIAQWCFRKNFCPEEDKNFRFQRVCQAISKYYTVVSEYCKKNE